MVFEVEVIENNKTALLRAVEQPSLLQPAVKQCSKDMRKLIAMLNKENSESRRDNLVNSIIHLSGLQTHMKFLGSKTCDGVEKSLKKRTNITSTVFKWQKQQLTSNNQIRTGFVLNLAHLDPITFLEDCKKLINCRIKNVLKKCDSLKVNTVFCGEFKIVSENITTTKFQYLKTENSPVYRDTNVNEWFVQIVMKQVLEGLKKIQEKENGWTLTDVVNLMINLTKFSPQITSSPYYVLHENNDNDAILELKRIGTFKPLLKAKDMMRGMEYTILGAKKVNTKYGKRVVLQLEKYDLFLPPRYVKQLSEKHIRQFNKNQYKVINKGPMLSTFEFEFVKTSK